MRQQKYPPPEVLFVDVDGCLISQEGEPDQNVIKLCRNRKAAGWSLVLWSSRGEAHARKAGETCGLTDLFDHIISKPGYIVDDRDWRWIQYTAAFRFAGNEWWAASMSIAD